MRIQFILILSLLTLSMISHASESPININAVDERRLTPLHIAAAKNDVPTMVRLIIADHKVNARSAEGHTPLYYAARNDQLDAVRMLLCIPRIIIDSETLIHASPAARELLIGASARRAAASVAHTMHNSSHRTKIGKNTHH